MCRPGLDLYDRQVETFFVAHTRGMLRFDRVDALPRRMAPDIAPTRELFSLD